MPRHQIGKTKTAQLWLRSCLRHPYEARSPLGSQSSDPSRFTRKSVSNISTHRVSIYDPFIPRWTPSLDSRPPFGILFLIPDIAIDRNPAPPLSGPISCVSHSYPCGLICAAVGCCLLAELESTSVGCQQLAESRVLQTALPCSFRFTCATPATHVCTWRPVLCAPPRSTHNSRPHAPTHTPNPVPPTYSQPHPPSHCLVIPPPSVTAPTLTAATAVRTNFEDHHLSNQSELGHAGLRA